MAIAKRWTKYTKENIKKVADIIGVYELGNLKTGKMLYMGEGKLRSRLLAHLPEGTRHEEIKVGADVFRYEIT